MITIFGIDYTKDQLKLIAKENGFQYRIRTKQFVISNCYFDIESETAYSYNWWCFFTKEDGTYYFNNYNYSPSTGKHQSKMSNLIESLMGLNRYTLHSYVNYCNFEGGLQLDFKSKYISQLYNDYIIILRTIYTKGTKKTKNVERRAKLERLKTRIKELKLQGFTSTFHQLYIHFYSIQKEYRWQVNFKAEKRAENRERNRLKRNKLAKLFCVNRELPLLKDIENENT